MEDPIHNTTWSSNGEMGLTQENPPEAPIDLPIILFCAVVFGLSLWALRGKDLLWPKFDQTSKAKAGSQGFTVGDNERCIVQRMASAGKNCVVFFGSQTGNAQDLAERLAKEGHSRFGLETMVADLEEYDYETLPNLPNDKIVIFVLSSYGEGEPTDNAVAFYNHFMDENATFSGGENFNDLLPLENIRYAIFGLGNSTYEHYNAVARQIDASLERRGAKRIVALGEGDDAKASTEDDYLAWKEAMWSNVCSQMNLHELKTQFEPAFLVDEEREAHPDSVFLGERSKDELEGAQANPSRSHNPSVAKVLKIEELFTSGERNCLHLELDIGSLGLEYQTGDHVAVWPMNADREVDRFLRVFGLLEKRNATIHISSTDSTSRLPFPTPTTYDAAVRYYLEIGGPISRQFLLTMAEFANDADQKATLTKLSKDKDYFVEVVSSRFLNLAQLIETISPNNPVCSIPFAVLIEGVRTLQPRYYSISSSSTVQRHTVSITAVVESINLPGGCFKGVATNYLLALKQQQSPQQQKKESQKSQSETLSYALSGPRGKYDLGLPIHIRHSSFKLPSDVTRPVVMVGPGTGVAPFRGFVQDRAAQAQNGASVGNMILFFGCRKESEDFIYKDEWQSLQEKLGNRFQIYTAFSREGKDKVYVQHRLIEHAAELKSLLVDQNGFFYICGDARMARQVQSTLSNLLSKELNVAESEGESIVKNMRTQGRFQEDVW